MCDPLFSNLFSKPLNWPKIIDHMCRATAAEATFEDSCWQVPEKKYVSSGDLIIQSILSWTLYLDL